MIYVVRTWLIHFDINFRAGKNRQTWQCYLTEAEANDWYSKNRHRWGNWKWLSKRFVFTYIILCIIVLAPLVIAIFEPDSQIVQEHEIQELVYLFVILVFTVAPIYI